MNGKPVNAYNRDEYFTLFSAVFQDINELPVSIAENISGESYERTDQEKLNRCMKQAGLYEKIMSLPEKEKTHLVRSLYDDAIELSGGQKQKMALIGRNGCGKSTLVKLLCRLYDPTKGEITLNGVDIRKYNYEEYMALFSVVFQDSKLFSFSVAENVAASTEFNAERVEDCVRRSGLSERLDSMPDGIETYLYKDFDEHGVEISGGEAQKICLARAVYKGSPFIVLDEPTAALDPISEHDIYTKFNSIVGTRTAIYISHRLSSCRFCDEITVMDHGEIVERGNHDDLIMAGGNYSKLWSAQAEYYRDTAGELFG